MAVSTTFKQQCPSCEAMVKINERLIGKKVECTKCKDKFIAERPGDDEEDAPQVKSAAKKETKLNGKKKTPFPKETGVTAKTPLPPGKRPKLEVADDDDLVVEEDEEHGKSNGKANGKAGKLKGATNGKANGKVKSRAA